MRFLLKNKIFLMVLLFASIPLLPARAGGAAQTQQAEQMNPSSQRLFRQRFEREFEREEQGLRSAGRPLTRSVRNRLRERIERELNDEQCTMCRELLFSGSGGQELIEMPCGHVMHQACAKEYCWQGRDMCPLRCIPAWPITFLLEQKLQDPELGLHLQLLQELADRVKQGRRWLEVLLVTENSTFENLLVRIGAIDGKTWLKREEKVRKILQTTIDYAVKHKNELVIERINALLINLLEKGKMGFDSAMMFAYTIFAIEGEWIDPDKRRELCDSALQNIEQRSVEIPVGEVSFVAPVCFNFFERLPDQEVFGRVLSILKVLLQKDMVASAQAIWAWVAAVPERGLRMTNFLLDVARSADQEMCELLWALLGMAQGEEFVSQRLEEYDRGMLKWLLQVAIGGNLEVRQNLVFFLANSEQEEVVGRILDANFGANLWACFAAASQTPDEDISEAVLDVLVKNRRVLQNADESEVVLHILVCWANNIAMVAAEDAGTSQAMLADFLVRQLDLIKDLLQDRETANSVLIALARVSAVDNEAIHRAVWAIISGSVAEYLNIAEYALATVKCLRNIAGLADQEVREEIWIALAGEERLSTFLQNPVFDIDLLHCVAALAGSEDQDFCHEVCREFWEQLRAGGLLGRQFFRGQSFVIEREVLSCLTPLIRGGGDLAREILAVLRDNPMFACWYHQDGVSGPLLRKIFVVAEEQLPAV